MHGVGSGGINHVHLPVVPGVERAYEVILLFGVGAERARGRALDQVAFAPRLLGSDSRLQRGVDCQVAGYPVPAFGKSDGLHLAVAGGETDRSLLAAAIYEPVCEPDVLRGREVIRLAVIRSP